MEIKNMYKKFEDLGRSFFALVGFLLLVYIVIMALIATIGLFVPLEVFCN